MKKINVAEWLSQEDMDKIEILENVVGVEDIPKQLLNFDRIFVYEDITKYGLGDEIASGLGIIDEENPYSKYFDYEKLADDLLNEDGSGYYTIKEDSKYLYIDDLCSADDGIVLGKIKTDFAEGQFVKLAKHNWACGRYWSYGHISNNGMSCGLEKYYDKTVDEVFEHTWITAEVWDKFRQGMKECGEVLGNKEDVDVLEKKLDSLWNYLMEEYQRIELILEGE